MGKNFKNTKNRKEEKNGSFNPKLNIYLDQYKRSILYYIFITLNIFQIYVNIILLVLFFYNIFRFMTLS